MTNYFVEAVKCFEDMYGKKCELHSIELIGNFLDELMYFKAYAWNKQDGKLQVLYLSISVKEEK